VKIVIVGAGPAGLYLAYLLRRQRRDAEITLVEQNSPGTTVGFGLVFSERTLDFLLCLLLTPSTLSTLTLGRPDRRCRNARFSSTRERWVRIPRRRLVRIRVIMPAIIDQAGRKSTWTRRTE
jgi:2-polyprenyl-6-methoxyphenol hydroxylase-like FAD-dependent oxidoreductase